jgi:hypothetical protein
VGGGFCDRGETRQPRRDAVQTRAYCHLKRSISGNRIRRATLAVLRQAFSESAVAFQVPFTAHRLFARRVTLGIQQEPNAAAR